MANRYQGVFNVRFSSHLIHISQAFGLMKGRLGVLCKPLQCTQQLYLIIVKTAMRLENPCINCGDPKELNTVFGLVFDAETQDWWEQCLRTRIALTTYWTRRVMIYCVT